MREIPKCLVDNHRTLDDITLTSHKRPDVSLNYATYLMLVNK